ncbi:MAG: FAD-binding protein [Chloroflexota bacterium]|nr:FAD-binding protein [Chloroflexota bacterium]
MILQANTPEEVQDIVRNNRCLLPRGGGSKPALSAMTTRGNEVILDLSALSGVLEYEPEEYTFTALAGTPVKEVTRVLAEHGQYLPFDPLLIEQGATLGGTVAAGTSGPGRYRYGGVRDFLLGIRFVDGEGELISGGGKVVKNAAGFDLPKLMVGSLGQYGVFVEVTFKVFPKPERFATLKVICPSLDDALHSMVRLTTSPLELHALELEPPDTLWVRIGGLERALADRLDVLRAFLGQGATLDGTEEVGFWRAARELEWVPEGWALVKVPITQKRIPRLEGQLATHDCRRRYGVGGNVAWVAWSGDLAELDSFLVQLELPGLVLLGWSERPLLGCSLDNAFARRVKAALDPAGRFLER